MTSKFTRGILGFALLLSLLTIRVWAQAVWGAINGYVTDPTGGAVPNATVTVSNVKTGVATKSSTDSAGFYNLTHLDPGEYSLAVEGSGFKKFTQENIGLLVDSTVRIDVRLELGSVTQEVTVTAAPPMLKTEKTDVAQSFNERQVEALPTLGRNLSKLYNTVPGVVQNYFQIGVGENPSESNQVLVNGSFFGSSEYQIDGITDTNNGHSGFQLIVPTQESVQEVKITTADYDPEFGSAAGFVAQYVTKSGTNDVHGSLFWFNSNKATFAADPFTEKIPGTGPEGKGLGPAPYNWNQAGFSLGGPIKKNKMFLFGDLQLTRTRQGGSAIGTVPNEAFRSGDFSGILGAALCYDPNSPTFTGVCDAQNLTAPIIVQTTEGAIVPAQENMVFDPTTGATDPASGTLNVLNREAFSCGAVVNVICSNRISPVAANILAILPGANLNQGTDNNFLGSGTVIFDPYQFDVRYDWNISEKQKFFGRYTFFQAHLVNPPLFGQEAGGPAFGGLSPQTGNFRMQQIALNYTHTFSPSLLAEVRLGLGRLRLASVQIDTGLKTNDKVGIPNINTDDPLTQGLAGITVAGPVGNLTMGITSGVGIPRFDTTTIIEGVNNWTKIRGPHQIRWGTDIRRIRGDLLSTLGVSTRGNFGFSQTVTGTEIETVPGTVASLSGVGLGTATFLLGLPTSFDRGILKGWAGDRHTRFAVYGQDIWRATPKLTINYGLRYDFFSPLTPRKAGDEVNIDLSTGDLLFAGVGDVSRSAGVKGDFNNFSPRIGFAYKVTQKTVIRAGFGRSYFMSNYGGGSYQLTINYPTVQAQFLSQPDIYHEVFPIDQGPPTPTPAVFPTSGRSPAPSGNFFNIRDLNKKNEYVDSWNLTAERQLAHDLRLSVAYVGNSGHVWDDTNINRAPAGPGDLYSRKPFVQRYGLDSALYYDTTSLRSNYHALQLVVEKRFSNGYTFNSAYTWAKALDTMPGGFAWGQQDTNPVDRKSSYGISDYNRASVWTLTHNWQLPYGKGLRWGSNATGVKKVLLAGWQFNGITTVESGFPVSPLLGDSSNLNGEFGQRPDRVSGESLIPSGGKTRTLWYSPAAFAPVPACCRWGNAARSSMRGPGLISANWALWKQFSFKTPLSREETTLAFRWESFNAFNNTNLGQPDNYVDSSTAGQITSLAGAGIGFGYIPMRRMQFGLRLAW